MSDLYEELEAANEEISSLRDQRNELLAEVREWLCSKCRTVYPGPPQDGFQCVLCPRCGGVAAPRLTIELKQARDQRDKLLAACEDLCASSESFTNLAMGGRTTLREDAPRTIRNGVAAAKMAIAAAKEGR